MRQFFTKKELKLKKKRLLMMVACMAVLLAGYVILTWPKKVESEAPTVIVESAEKGDVEIYGEYVGRIRAQQFVEVRARVEWKGIWRICFSQKEHMSPRTRYFL